MGRSLISRCGGSVFRAGRRPSSQAGGLSVGGQTLEQIADELGMSKGGVLLALRRLLGAEDDEEEEERIRFRGVRVRGGRRWRILPRRGGSRWREVAQHRGLVRGYRSLLLLRW